jgi:hypothetical protein
MTNANPDLSGRIMSVDFIVQYPDGSLKRQTWQTADVEKTSKLVLRGDEVNRLKKKTDWRQNPCMIRYFRRGAPSEPICQLGGKKRWLPFGKYRKRRGSPNKFDLNISHASGANVKVTLDRALLDDTVELLFLPHTGLGPKARHKLLSNADWRKNAILIRKKANGELVGVFPKGNIPAAQRTSIADNLCGIRSPARTIRC